MRYELGDNGKILVTKDQILSMVECSRSGLSTKPAALVSCAAMYSKPPAGHGDTPWARQVIDYPAAERLFSKLVHDGVLVGQTAYEWVKLGVAVPVHSQTMYYATAGTSRHIRDGHSEAAVTEYTRRVRQTAMEKLASRHLEEFEVLVKETEENLPGPL